jgi:hypothetical protein
MVTNMNVNGTPTTAVFRLGVLSGHGYIEQNGNRVLAFNGYAWCQKEAPGLFQDQDQYCLLTTISQVTAVTMAGLGFAAIVMSCLLCCTTVRDAHRTMVGMLDAIMILLQSFCGTAAFASWFFVQQWINRDLNQFYPGVRVDFGYAWYVMVSATGLAFFSALFATCCCTRPSRKLAATPKGRIAQTNDEDLRQIIATY